MGKPGRVVLVELGPGRGTLMADFLRTAKGVPGFAQALDIHLVETSPVLAEVQRAALRGTPVSRHDAFATVPAGPIILIANEFFDALPVEQYVARRDGWHRRAVDIDGDGFRFVDGPCVSDPPWPGGTSAEEGEVRETNPDVKFLALSVSDAAEDVIAMIRAGARGYVTKSIGPDDLADAIRRVNEGDAVFSPMLAGFVLDTFSMDVSPASDPELDRLTSREKEVLRLIARGYPYKQVAKRLFISVKTVESHVSAVLRKLQLSSRHELAHWATHRRIV